MADRSARYGTKSCVECRRRKIRCIWPSEDGGRSGQAATACEHCASRGLRCTSQRVRPSAASLRSSTRDRIGLLEQEVSSLSALVRDRSSETGREVRTSQSSVDPSDMHSGDESDASAVETASPAHLRLLFDNLLVDEEDTQSSNTGSMHATSNSSKVARSKMQTLLPSLDIVSQLSSYASGWMTLYQSLFPSSFIYGASEDLALNYPRMKLSDVSITVLAMYLLLLAITAQQPIPDDIEKNLHGGRGRRSFVGAVYRAVERYIINKDTIAASVDGLETTMLAVRLSLGRGDLRSAWVIMRRAVALAELIGLPKAGPELLQSSTLTTDEGQEALAGRTLHSRTAVWEAICATDRNFSMMLNLPPATQKYPFPLRIPPEKYPWKNDGVFTWRYNYELSQVCYMIFEVDELYSRGASEAESYEKVLMADRLLRESFAGPPKTWWQMQPGAPLAEKLVKFWHYYLTARVHLRPAMVRAGYPYSELTCRESCLEAVGRFVDLRPAVPSGFFVCRVVDVQAFTAAAYLLLTETSNNISDRASSSLFGLVDKAVDCWRSVSHQEGSDFAREAVDAIRVLQRMVMGEAVRSSGALTLQIPLLGKVHIKTSIASEPENDNANALWDTTTPLQALQSNKSQDYMSTEWPSTNSTSISQQTTFPMDWSIEFDDAFSGMTNASNIDYMTAFDLYQASDNSFAGT